MSYIGNTPSAVPLTSADIAPGTIEASDLNSTLNLSSKTVTLPANSVTAHVTSFDDSDIRSDILHLAIAQSLNDNRIAFSLEDSFVDTFEDSSGIDAGGNLTNVARDTTGEYVSSIYTVVTTTQSASGLWSGDTGSVTFSGDDITTTTGDKQIYLTGVISGDFELDAIIGLNSPSGGAFGVFRSNETITGTNDFNNMTNIWYYDRPNMGGSSTTAIAYGQSYPGGGSVTTSNGDAYKLERVSGVFKMYLAGTLRHTYTQEDTGDVKIIFGWSGVTGNYINDVNWTSSVLSTNATGTLISDPQTASSSRNSVSGVIIYEDAEGTATLGTDLKIYFTANNGTNWTEAASYGTATTYSGTKKLVKLGATTVTAGTQIAMKAVWANQAATVASSYVTGDRTSTITVTDDGVINDGDGVPAKLVDGVTNANSGSATTFFAIAVAGKYIRFQFSTSQIITEAKWYQSATNTHGVWKWQGSNDASTWTDIGNSFTLGGTLQTQTELNGNTTSYTYYQLLGVSGNSSGSPWVREIEFKPAAIAGKEARLHGWACNF